MSTEGAALSREERKVENKDVRILVIDDEPTMADSLRQNAFGRLLRDERSTSRQFAPKRVGR